MPVRPNFRRLARFVSVFAAVVGLAVAPGCVTRPLARISVQELPAAQRERAEQNLRVFNAVWDLVNRRHYDPRTRGPEWEREAATFGPRAAAAPDEKALYLVLNEMLELLHDSHTHALTPEQSAERRTRERARTGFSMSRVEDRWVVTDVLPDSPAGRAGVMAGWIVLLRNGEPLGRRPDFRASEGEEVRWRFLDAQDRVIDLPVKATRLSIAPLQVERALPGGFVYLRFDGFDAKDRRWLGARLRAHEDAPGVVIDLRRNSGGETFSLGISLGEFFDHAVEWGTFIDREGARKAKSSWQLGSAHYHGRVIVLVDESSASAAEIFAAVLQDQGRATVVGRRTAGAVLASWFYRLPGGGTLQLSREDYLTPGGRRLEGAGVAPDVSVTRSLADARAGRDPDLEAALAILRTPQAPARRTSNLDTSLQQPGALVLSVRLPARHGFALRIPAEK